VSSSTERESSVDSKVAKALEAVKNPFLREIGMRVDSPSQVPKIGRPLKFTDSEEEHAKALVWLKKNEPAKYEVVLQASEVNTKKRRQRMKVKWGEEHFVKEFRRWFKRACGYSIELYVGNSTFYCFSNSFLKFCHDVFPIFPPILCAATIKTANGEIFSKGYTDLIVNVTNEKHLEAIRKFARAYERKTGKKVKIYKEY